MIYLWWIIFFLGSHANWDFFHNIFFRYSPLISATNWAVWIFSNNLLPQWRVFWTHVCRVAPWLRTLVCGSTKWATAPRQGSCSAIIWKMASFGWVANNELLNWSRQLRARYLEGDKVPTKIGSGRVKMEIGEASPTFLTNPDRDWGGQPDILKFRVNSGRVEIGLDLSRIASIYPDLPWFIPIYPKFPRFIPNSLDLSGLLSQKFE